MKDREKKVAHHATDRRTSVRRAPSVFRRWSWLGLSLVFAGGIMTMLIGRHYLGGCRAPVGPGRAGGTSQELLTTPTLQPSPTPAATNQSGTEATEDKVVALVTQGNELLARGNYVEAAQKFEQALRAGPGDEDVHYNLGIALAKQGRFQEAKQHYTQALEIFPEHADAHNNLGNLLMNENKLAEAIEHFRVAIRLMPEHASFHNNLGTAFGRQRQVTEAIESFSKAVELNPNYVEARVNMANACLAAGRVDEAMAQLKEALRLQPNFEPALQMMQRARQRQSTLPPR